MRQPHEPLADRHGARAAALRDVRRMIVDQHQVEVRPGHHLPPAGLAQSDHRHAAAAHPAEPRGEIRQDGGSNARSAASAIAVRRRPAASASSRPSMVATEMEKSSSFTARLVSSIASSSPRASRSRRRSAAGASSSSGDSSPSSADGIRRQMIGQRRRGTQHRGDAVQQRRIALEQRQQLHAGGLRAEEPVEPAERVVRDAAARRCGPGSTGSITSISSRARADRSARTWPAIQERTRGDDVLGSPRTPCAATHRSSRAGRGRRRGNPGSGLSDGVIQGRWQHLEHRRVMHAYPASTDGSASWRTPRRRETPETCAMRARSSGFSGRDVGLPVVDHLQPVLDLAQEAVGLLQLDARPAAAHGRRASAAATRQASCGRATPDRGRPRPVAASAPGTRSPGCRPRPA